MRLIVAILMIAGFVSLADAAYIHAKAILAQWLIRDAWAETLAQGPRAAVKPWRWADTWPVARLRMADGEEYFVLEGDDGTALAFGPGHASGTAFPGESGSSVIAGHRDTHFRGAFKLQKGDVIRIQNRGGEWSSYDVVSQQVVDTRRTRDWWIDPSQDEVHLVTCYPPDAITPGGPLRYVVSATREH